VRGEHVIAVILADNRGIGSASSAKGYHAGRRRSHGEWLILLLLCDIWLMSLMSLMCAETHWLSCTSFAVLSIHTRGAHEAVRRHIQPRS